MTTARCLLRLATAACAAAEVLDGCRGPLVLALRIPADERASVRLVVLPLTASALSDEIGGGFLEDALTTWCGGSGLTFYVDEHRAAKGLRGNERAAMLSVRLGQAARGWLAELRGDVLVLGCDEGRDDVSVPWFVVEASARSGLMVDSADVAR